MRIVILLAVLLSGCAFPVSQVSSNLPPGYRAGYRDGCSSGEAAAGSLLHSTRRDVSRSLNDREYAMGWEDGFRSCKGQHEDLYGGIRYRGR